AVTGVDIAANQIAAAKALAEQQGLDIAFQVCPAEKIDFPDASFDVISTGQSWLYFDSSVMIPKVLRLLRAEGCLVLIGPALAAAQGPDSPAVGGAGPEIQS